VFGLDLVIATYALVQRNEEIRQYTWKDVILDEALTTDPCHCRGGGLFAGRVRCHRRRSGNSVIRATMGGISRTGR